MANELVDVFFTVAVFTTLDKVNRLLALVTTSRVGELEGPEEVVGLLKVGANSIDFVNQILDANDAKLAQRLFNDRVVRDWHALLVNLGESALVDELADSLEVGVSPRNVRADPLEHLEGSLVELDKDTRVDAVQTEKLHNLSGLGGHLVDTLDTDNKGQLVFRGNVEGSIGLGLATETNLITLLGQVLLDVLFGTLEDDLALVAGFLEEEKWGRWWLIRKLNIILEFDLKGLVGILGNVSPERWLMFCKLHCRFPR